MAQKKEEDKDMYFYLYDYSNTLAMRSKIIYSPYNVISHWRTKSEDWYDKPDFVTFNNGIYILSRKDCPNEEIYEQRLEWLQFYNTSGGMLNKGRDGQKHLNGRRYKNDGIHIVRMEKIVEDIKTKTITETVTVQQIPFIIAQSLHIDQLEELAMSWNVELPADLKESGNAETIKTRIIDVLREAGNIS